MLRAILGVALLAGASAFAPSPFSIRGSAKSLSTSVAKCRSGPHVAQVMAKLGAVLFDCDGVLADTERDGHRVSFNQAFKEFGLKVGDKPMEWDVDTYGVLLEIGGGKERMMAYWQEIGWEQGDWELAKKLHERKTKIFSDLIVSGQIPLRPGVLRVVDQIIAAKVPIAVCSTSNEKAVQQIVDLMGKERASKIKIFAGDCVPRKKPSPDIYNLAKERLQVKAEDCVVIEDSGIGLAAAKGASLACIITKSTYTKNEDFRRADLIVDDLEVGDIDLDTLEGLAPSTALEDWGIRKDIDNSNVGRGRW